MNYTYYYFCECGFEQPVNQEKGETILQCTSCMQLESKESQIQYTIICNACNHPEEISFGTTFGEEKNCIHCGLKGKISFNESEKELFSLKVSKNSFSDCTKCKKQRWTSPDETDFKCPRCFKFLKQKLSNYWD